MLRAAFGSLAWITVDCVGELVFLMRNLIWKKRGGVGIREDLTPTGFRRMRRTLGASLTRNYSYLRRQAATVVLIGRCLAVDRLRRSVPVSQRY